MKHVIYGPILSAATGSGGALQTLLVRSGTEPQWK